MTAKVLLLTRHRALLGQADAETLAAALKAVPDPARFRLISIVAASRTGELHPAACLGLLRTAKGCSGAVTADSWPPTPPTN